MTSKEQDNSNTIISELLNRRVREPKGKPINGYVLHTVNGVLQPLQERCIREGREFTPLVYKSGSVRLLSDDVFDSLRGEILLNTVHPCSLKVLDNLVDDERQVDKSSDPIDQIDVFNAGYGRSPNIYVRQTAVDPREFERHFPRSLRQEARNYYEIMKIGLFLVRDGIFRSEKARVTPIKDFYRELFVEPIIKADAKRQSLLVNEEKREEYLQRILEYIEGKDLIVICHGARIALETEGMLIAVAQLDFDQSVTAYLTEDLLPEFIDRLKKNNQLFRNRTEQMDIEEVINKYFPYELEMAPGINKEDVIERLEVLGGDEEGEQLELYLSGRYFDNHLQVLPERVFLP